MRWVLDDAEAREAGLLSLAITVAPAFGYRVQASSYFGTRLSWMRQAALLWIQIDLKKLRFVFVS